MASAERLALLAGLLAMALACPLAAGGIYYNISNAPFATISNGPQNAIIVDVANPSSPVEVKSAVEGALRIATTRAAGGAIGRQIARLRQAGLIRPDVHAITDALVLVRSGGTFTGTTRAARAYGGGEITFQYSGWAPDVQAKLQAFAQLAYPIVKGIYGNPSGTFTVTVVSDAAQTVVEQFLGGVYVTGSGVQRQIRIFPNPSGGLIDLERMFLYSMIRAFHDTAAFQYDAWEEGFKRAAAVAAGELVDQEIARNPALGLVPMDFVGREGPGDVFSYLMSTYELLNQPPVSNNRFVTSWTDVINTSQNVFGGMFIPRLGTSSTAWLKVYIERLRTDGQSFFKLFNGAYYQQLSGNPGTAGNVPALVGIAAGVTPTVEGLAFSDWFRRQYIFDTSVSIGKKLYAYSVPPDAPKDPATEGYSMPVFLIYYQTTATGDETPLSGIVYPVYWNYLYDTDIFTHAQYEQVDIANGEGYVTPTFYPDNMGGNQRVAMDFTIGTETARVFFPVGMAGTEASPNNFQGTVVGANSGSVNLKVDAEAAGTDVPVTNGAFGAILPSLLGFSRLTITFSPPVGDVVMKLANAGPGTYLTLIYARGEAKTFTHTFPGGLRLMSVPMTTFAQDQAQALQGADGKPAVPADKLLLARWNPLISADYKYEMYPRTPPFAPGKGYWVKFPASTPVTVTGETPEADADWRIGLSYGWNQIGGPFESSIPIGSLLVEKANDEPISFLDAWSTGLVGKIIWKYTPGAGYEQASSLDPWEGYWIKCNVANGVVLIVPGPGSRSRARTAVSEAAGRGPGRAEPPSRDTWSIKLSARSLEGDGSAVTLGVAPGATDGFDNAFDAESPPSYGRVVKVASLVSGRAGDGCALDTRPASAVKTSWEVTVVPGEPNQDIVLRWQDIASAPKRCRLTLLDQATGRNRFMRTTSAYRFNSGDGSPRRFTVIADSSPAARLMITNVIPSATRGPSVSFSYNLSADAQVAAEIVGSDGRRVRALEQGRPTRSGINSLLWDKRDDQGRPVPAGVYILQLTAATEDGEMVKNVRPVLIAR